MERVDILDFAMQMEKDGETFYRKCAEGTNDSGIAGIMYRLAEAEVIHYKVLQQIKEDRPVDSYDEVTMAGDVKNLFAQMLEGGTSFAGETSEVELYKRAQQMERDAREFYLREAENIESEAGKEIFLRIAKEEEYHVDYIGSIIEFVERAEPGNWLETAEWYHKEEY